MFILRCSSGDSWTKEFIPLLTSAGNFFFCAFSSWKMLGPTSSSADRMKQSVFPREELG